MTAVLSRPRTVALAGRPYLVGELTLGDVADLQAFLDATRPDPIPGLRAAIEGLDAPARLAALQAAHAAAGDGPPCWGDPEATRLLLTDDGFAELVRVALRRHQPRLTGDEARSVAIHTTLAEYDGLMRALVRSDPREEIARMMGLRNQITGDPITWAEALVEVATMLGKMPHELGGMALSEFRAVRTGGKPRAAGMPLIPGKGLRRRLAEARLKVFGADDGKGAG